MDFIEELNFEEHSSMLSSALNHFDFDKHIYQMSIIWMIDGSWYEMQSNETYSYWQRISFPDIPEELL